MDAELVVALLEQNWNGLQSELGGQWQEFAQSYDDIVARLPAEPDREDIERAIDGLCDLMSHYEYGRGLLRGSQVPISEKLLAAPPDTLGDREQTRQVCNRLRELPRREQKEPQKSKETK